MQNQAKKAARLMRMLSSPHRLLILCQLTQGEMNAGDITELVGLSQSAVSQHLAKLRSDGLVSTRRESQNIFYSLASDEVAAIVGHLYDLYCNDSPRSLKEIKK